MSTKGASLTPKQAAFARNLFKGMSQREAYVKAGYSDRSSVDSIDQLACRLAESVKISSRIAELAKQAEDASIMTVVERKQILTKGARGELKEVQIVEVEGPGGEVTSRTKIIKTAPRAPHVVELNKMERIGAQDVNIQVNIINNYNFVIEQMVSAFKEINLLADPQERIQMFAQKADAIIEQIATKVKGD